MTDTDFNANFRQEYHSLPIAIDTMAANPFEEFSIWWQHAQSAQIPEMNAATLATADQTHAVHARIILIKNFSANGFLFFTNYMSQKGLDLQINENAALVLWWQPITRQIRLQGKVEKTSAEESDNYFLSRPRDYQIGAWASQQSQKLSSPKELQNRYKDLQEQYANTSIPRPPHWGGYRLCPNRFEFWIGKEHRLHHRVVYELSTCQQWQRYYLFP